MLIAGGVVIKSRAAVTSHSTLTHMQKHTYTQTHITGSLKAGQSIFGLVHGCLGSMAVADSRMVVPTPQVSCVCVRESRGERWLQHTKHTHSKLLHLDQPPFLSPAERWARGSSHPADCLRHSRGGTERSHATAAWGHNAHACWHRRCWTGSAAGGLRVLRVETFRADEL